MKFADPALVMERDNIQLGNNTGWLWQMLCGLGVVCLVLTFIGGLGQDAFATKIALHSYLIGVAAAVGLPLGSLGFVMIFHQTNAGWVATLRRTFENYMSLVWVAALLFAGLAALQVFALMGDKGVYLWSWMDAKHVAGDPVYEWKKPFLNVPFFIVRVIAYFGVWGLLSFFLFNWSTRQDVDGDRMHTFRARKLSSIGLLLFAFTTAFAAFDWMMSLDYHWFSTMFGVWFFAGNAVSTIAAVSLALILLRSFGRLHGAFTQEHLHDMGKLLFAFTVFWAYISFSQYFLIWYANIPEETAFFLDRKTGSFSTLSWVLPICHFIIPFLWLLPRPGRRSMMHVGIAAAWILVMHVMDLYFVIRPEAGEFKQSTLWLEIVGIAGPILVLAGMFIRQLSKNPLVAVHDPRLSEALEHKNYV